MAARSAERIHIQVEVKIHSNGKTYPATVTNLSEEGMFVRLSRRFDSFAMLPEISLSLERETIMIAGKVVRTEERDGCLEGMAIILSDPPASYARFIDALIETM